MAIYEAIATEAAPRTENSSRSVTLLVQFAKVASRNFEVRHNEEIEKTILPEHKRSSRLLIPFVASPGPEKMLTGVFFTGDQPCWILATDKGGVKIHSCGYSIVHSFTACSIWESKSEFLMYTDEVIIFHSKSQRRSHINLLTGSVLAGMDAGHRCGKQFALEVGATF